MANELRKTTGELVFKSDAKAHNSQISADAVLHDTEFALKRGEDVVNSIIDGRNQRVERFNKINNSFLSINKIDLLNKLKRESDADLSKIHSMLDYKSAKVKWQRDISKLTADPNTGKISPEIAAVINTVGIKIDEKGIAIGASEANMKALQQSNNLSRYTSIAIARGNLQGANSNFRQNIGAINAHINNGTIGADIGSALLAQTKRRFNDGVMGAIIHKGTTALNLSGHAEAVKYVNKVGGMVDISRGSLPKQEAYSRFIKSLKKMPKAAVVKTYNKSIENSVRYGIGNPIHLMKAASQNIKYLEGLKSDGTTSSGHRRDEGITSLQNDIKAYQYTYTALGDLYNKGGASKFKAFLTGINSSNINEFINDLGISDPDLIQKVARQLSIIKDRFLRESGGDPVKLAMLMDRNLGKSISSSPTKVPQGFLETIKKEKAISSKYYGKEILSKNTKDNAEKNINDGDFSRSGELRRRKLMKAIGKNLEVQKDLLKERNGGFNIQIQNLATRHPKGLENIYPTPENRLRVNSLLKKDGFKRAQRNVKSVMYGDDVLKDLTTTANALGIARDELSYAISLEVLVGANTASNPKSKGLRYDQLEQSPDGEGVEDKLKEGLISKLKLMRNGFYTKGEGNFSVSKESSLGRGLQEYEDTGNIWGKRFNRLINNEQFNGAKTVLDLFSKDDFLVDKQAAFAKIKFHRKIQELTGLPLNKLEGKLKLKQHEEGGDYYLVIKDEDHIGYDNVHSTIKNGLRGMLRISENSMKRVLKLKSKHDIIELMTGAITHDTR